MKNYKIRRLYLFVINVLTVAMLGSMYLGSYYLIEKNKTANLIVAIVLYIFILMLSLFQLRAYVKLTTNEIIGYSGFSKKSIVVIRFDDITQVTFTNRLKQIIVHDGSNQTLKFSVYIKDYKGLYHDLIKHFINFENIEIDKGLLDFLDSK